MNFPTQQLQILYWPSLISRLFPISNQDLYVEDLQSDLTLNIKNTQTTSTSDFHFMIISVKA